MLLIFHYFTEKLVKEKEKEEENKEDKRQLDFESNLNETAEQKKRRERAKKWEVIRAHLVPGRKYAAGKGNETDNDIDSNILDINHPIEELTPTKPKKPTKSIDNNLAKPSAPQQVIRKSTPESIADTIPITTTIQPSLRPPAKRRPFPPPYEFEPLVSVECPYKVCTPSNLRIVPERSKDPYKAGDTRGNPKFRYNNIRALQIRQRARRNRLNPALID